MKILFFSSMRGGPWGGSEPLWTQTAALALQQGHTVAISVFDWPTPAAQVTALGDQGAKIIPRPLRPSRFTSLFSKPEWVRKIDLFAADAICLSQGSAFECVGRRSTRPLLDVLLRSGARVVNLVQYNAPTRLRPFIRRRASRLVRRADVNAFVADRNIADAERTLGHEMPNAIVVRNPVNITNPSPLEFPSGSTLRLACVARLDCRIKQQDVLIRALASSAWASRDWSLSLFGEGPDREALRALIGELNLQRRVMLRGQSSDIRAVWAEHHALVLPSAAEGTPLSMVEAMLLGRPCLVTDVGGCGEWITDGHSGWLAQPTEVGMQAALERLWLDRSRCADMGAAARVRAVDLHDPSPARTLLDLLVQEKPVSSTDLR